MAIISLLGLYNVKPTLLDGLFANLPTEENLPKEYPETYLKGVRIDEDALKYELLAQTAEQEVLYTNPDMLKLQITYWARKQSFVWQHLYNTICLNYNPIWNKDGTNTITEEEDTTGTNSLSRKTTDSGSETGSSTTTDTNKTTENGSTRTDDTSSNSVELTASTTLTKNATSENSVAAYNTSTYSARDKNTQTETDTTENDNTTVTNIERVQDSSTENTQEGAGTSEYSGKKETSNSGTLEDTGNDTKNRRMSHTERQTGNIGVTMTQEMIEKERELATFNMIDFIIADFKRRFILMVY